MGLEGKKIASLAEATSLADTDVFVMETATPVTKKTKWLTICNAIKAKIKEFVFDNLGTTNKTLPGAINEINEEVKKIKKVYIEESGKSGIWQYYKYSDGTFECFTPHPHRFEENADISTSWGNTMLESAEFTYPDLPFESKTYLLCHFEYVEADPGTRAVAFIAPQGYGAKKKLPTFTFVRPEGTHVTLGHPQVSCWVRGTFR